MAAQNADLAAKRIKFVLLAVAIFVGIAIFFGFGLRKEHTISMKTVKIPFFQGYNVLKLDPAHISDSIQSNLLRSIYATLVYFDSDGSIRPGAAESFQVFGNKIKFKIRNSLKTVEGKDISAEDVFLSFKRQLVLNKNTHGRLTDFLDCYPLPTKITDSCIGISYVDDVFEITLKSGKYISYFLPMLTSPDFSIIPKASIDLESDELAIIDYKNTSGAYYISELTPQAATFKINKSNYLVTEENPAEIIIVFNVGNDRNARFRNGDFDVIPTFGVFTAKDVKEMGDLSSYNLHQTLPIQLTLVDFSSNGRQRLGREERLAVGKLLKKAYLDEYQKVFELLETKQYFVVVGEGELSSEQLSFIEKSFLNADSTIVKNVSADIAVTWPERARKIIERISGMVYKELLTGMSPNDSNAPDVFVKTTDAGGFDNITLLSYIQSVKGLGMTDAEFSEWLDSYLETDNISDRLRKFRDLHFKMLSEAQVVPIAAEPYYAIARKPWKVNGYQMFAGTPFWMIKHE